MNMAELPILRYVTYFLGMVLNGSSKTIAKYFYITKSSSRYDRAASPQKSIVKTHKKKGRTRGFVPLKSKYIIEGITKPLVVYIFLFSL